MQISPSVIITQDLPDIMALLLENAPFQVHNTSFHSDSMIFNEDCLQKVKLKPSQAGGIRKMIRFVVVGKCVVKSRHCFRTDRYSRIKFYYPST